MGTNVLYLAKYGGMVGLQMKDIIDLEFLLKFEHNLKTLNQMTSISFLDLITNKFSFLLVFVFRFNSVDKLRLTSHLSQLY